MNVLEYVVLFVLVIIMGAAITNLDLTQTLLSNAGLNVGETISGIIMITLFLLTMTFALTYRRR